MDPEAFRTFLKRSGRKPHVIDGLVRQLANFEAFLAAREGRDLAGATPQDILEYAAVLEAGQPGSARKGMRGLALYYHSVGDIRLAETAAGQREQAIARLRRAFPLREFPGIGPGALAALKTVGIVQADQMLEAGRTPAGRKELSERTGVPLPVILELVKLSDLSRLTGVKAVRARLYHDAGFDTVEKIAAQEPGALLQRTAEFVARTGFPGLPPLPKEVRSTIEEARRLPAVCLDDKG